MMSRFCAYIDKVFDFGDWVGTVVDSRQAAQIETPAIWTSAFFMMATHRGSLNALESDLRCPKRMDGWIGGRKPSVDRIGDVFCLMDSEPLRAMLSGINHQLGRNKALPGRWPLRFVAVDGHEFFSQSKPVLSGMPPAQDQGEGGGGDRILSSRRGLPPGGV